MSQPTIEAHAPAFKPAYFALAAIESGNKHSAVGKHGERSAYQISKAVYKDFLKSYPDCPVSFEQLSNNSARSFRAVELITRWHVQRIAARFYDKTLRMLTMQEFYVVWNAGFHYYEKCHFKYSNVSAVIRERAERFATLCTPNLNN